MLRRSKRILTSDWLELEIDKRLHPEKYIVEEHRQTFFEAYEEFIEKRKLSDWRVRAIRVVIRALRRYELYARRTVDSRFVLDLDTVTPLVLRDIEEFLRNEHTFATNIPKSMRRCPKVGGLNREGRIRLTASLPSCARSSFGRTT